MSLSILADAPSASQHDISASTEDRQTPSTTPTSTNSATMMHYIYSITDYLGLTASGSASKQTAVDDYDDDLSEDDEPAWRTRGGMTRNSVSASHVSGGGGKPKCPEWNKGKCRTPCPSRMDHRCSRCSSPSHPAVRCR
ncbi:hypothetical protein BD626DRAFT_273806 [Schizophyllum amplum]|uniref:Uncharacterized protein n=1 Tax=Schizophyllum amplum TaxID=97359 RepID=A0A550CFL9_9AGAR|nr:hypothetical protein BD626DRAFT_273806 [Auriculariopsis ampla]